MTPQEKMEGIKSGLSDKYHHVLDFKDATWLIARVEQLEGGFEEILKLDPFDQTHLLSNPPQNKETFKAIQIARKVLTGPEEDK